MKSQIDLSFPEESKETKVQVLDSGKEVEFKEISVQDIYGTQRQVKKILAFREHHKKEEATS